MTSAGRDRDRDAGTATLFVVGLTMILFGLAGLVVDGGLALNARERVADDVEQAARAGAERVDVPTLRSTGRIVLDAVAAQQAAAAFLAARGYASTDISITSGATTVTAQARERVPTALLSLVFVNSFQVSARATARAAVGITAEVP